LVKLV